MITALQPSPVRVTSAPAPQPAPAPAPQDTFAKSTPLRNVLAKMNPYAAGAVIGVGTLDPPLVGGLVGGLPGALVGTAVAFGFNYAIDKNAGRSLSTVIWPGIMGLLVSTGHAAPTPLTLGLTIGLGAAMGVLAVWRNKIEENIKHKP